MAFSDPPYDSVYSGVWGYNGILAAEAIMFFMVPSVRSVLLALLNAVLATMIQAALGESIRVPISNRTAFHHAMHLHGTHFREVLAEGSLGPWRDTLLIDPGTTREVAFVAENPGDWMFHCHMPAHQMSGMMNWVRVT